MREPDWVLVVSPDSTTLQGLTRALGRRGWPVAPALGWAQSRSWLARIPVSLLVADLGELGADDLVRLRQLRADHPQLGIIGLVSLWTPEARAAEADGAVLAVLEKPIALESLEEVVSAALLPTAFPRRPLSAGGPDAVALGRPAVSSPRANHRDREGER